MNRSRFQLGLGALGVALVGALFVLWFWQRERDLRSQEVRVHTEFATNWRLAAALRALRPAATAVPLLATQSPVRPPVATATPPAANNVARGHQINEKLREMPEYAPHLRRQLRRWTMRDYGGFFAGLKYSPERLEALKHILDDNRGTSQDVLGTAYEHGYKQGTPEFSRLMQAYWDEAERRLRDFLGTEDYARFTRFKAGASWQNGQLRELEDYFGDRGVPALTIEQKRALNDAYLESRKWRPASGSPPPGVHYRMSNEQVGVLAAAALEPAQHEALVAYLKFFNSRNQVQALLLHPDQPDSVIVSVTNSR